MKPEKTRRHYHVQRTSHRLKAGEKEKKNGPKTTSKPCFSDSTSESLAYKSWLHLISTRIRRARVELDCAVSSDFVYLLLKQRSALSSLGHWTWQPQRLSNCVKFLKLLQFLKPVQANNTKVTRRYYDLKKKLFETPTSGHAAIWLSKQRKCRSARKKESFFFFYLVRPARRRSLLGQR